MDGPQDRGRLAKPSSTYTVGESLSAGVLVDHFQVIRLIGRGGMGEVYLARDTMLGRKVALKIIRPRALGRSDSVARFLQEARISAQFNHPHIVTIHSVGEHSGHPYVALEFLEGESLRERLRQEPPSLTETLRIGLAVAEALVEAHSHQVLHRDIKPENILLPTDGRLRVVDFGLAKALEADEGLPATPDRNNAQESADNTTLQVQESFLVGTPLYMAPEQWVSGTSSEAADVWALGVVLYEVLNGHHPYEIGTVSELRKVVSSPDPIPPFDRETVVPEDALQIIMRCLDKTPRGRPAAVEIAATFRKLLSANRGDGRATGSPFRGLMPFTEQDSDFFFGRDDELAAFLERLRGEPILGVVGPSGGGKSSYVMAGVIPRLRENGSWRVLRMRPGSSPFMNLARRVVRGEMQSSIYTSRLGDPTLLTSGKERARKGGVEAPRRNIRGALEETLALGDLPPQEAEFGMEETLAPGDLPPGEAEIGMEETLAPGDLPPGEAEIGMEETLAPDDLPQKGAEIGMEETLAPDALPHAMATSGETLALGTIVPGANLTPPSPETHPASSDEKQIAAAESRLVAELLQTPSRLSLVLNELAEQEQARVLLFVDQLEELYTLTEDRWLRQAFMEAICRAADDPDGPVRVVFTLRDDFLVRLADTAVAREAMAHIVVLRSPGSALLAETLRRPLEKVGYSFEDPGLVTEMVQAVQGEPAGLPVLQFAASTLWERRDRERRMLTREAYKEIGGVEGALAGHAEQLLEGLPPHQVDLARKLLLRLVTPSGTRRITSRTQLLEGLDAEATAVLERLTHGRAILVRKGKDRQEAELELVHESLIRNWSRFRRWIEEGHEEVAFLHEVAQAAELWKTRGRPREEVWRGSALQEATARAKRCQVVPETVRSFLGAGQHRARQQSRRRNYAIVGALVALATIALVLAWKEREARRAGSLAVAQRRHAQRQRARAEVQRRRARHQRAAAQREGAQAAFERGDMLEARAKLRAALETVDSPQARGLWRTLREHPLVWKRKIGALFYDVAISPDGRHLAAVSSNHAVYLVNSTTRFTRVLRGHRSQVSAVAFLPDGKRLVTGALSGGIRLWDLTRGDSQRLEGHKGMISDLSVSPDGKRLVSVSRDKTMRLWTLNAQPKSRVLATFKQSLGAVAYDCSGGRVALTLASGEILLWDLKRAAVVQRLRGHTRRVERLIWSQDCRHLASASRDQTARLWDVVAGTTIQTFKGHTAAILGADLSRDGRWLVTASHDRTIRLWSLTSGKVVRVLRGHTDNIGGVVFRADGQRLASASYDGTIRLWNLQSPRVRRAVPGHTGSAEGLAFTPDGKQLVSGAFDGTLRIWDVATGEVRRVIQAAKGYIEPVAVSPDGKWIASAGGRGHIRLTDLSTGISRRALRGHRGQVTAVRFSPHGRSLASSGKDGTIRIWDPLAATVKRLLRGHHGGVRGVAWSPDERRLASTGWDGTVRVWDLASGRTMKVLRGHRGVIWDVAWTPDGRRLVTGGATDHTVRVWQVSTGQGRTLGSHKGRIGWIDMHPNGTHVGTPSGDGTARIWNLSTGSYQELQGHRDEVDCLRFSPDGRLVATTSQDGTVRTWLARSGRPHWRAVLLLQRPPRLLTHLGWRGLAPGVTASPPPSAWRRAVESRARSASEDTRTGRLCIRTHDHRLELWDPISDRRLFEVALRGLTTVQATPLGCLAIARGRASLHRAKRPPVELALRATAVAWTGTQILVAADRQVLVFSATGRQRRSIGRAVGVSALTRAGDHVVLGFRDGSIELVTATAANQTPLGRTFEQVPSSAVVRMVPGPMNTVIAGFSNGMIGIWLIKSGRLIYRAMLHGAVIHLARDADKLHVATELGRYMTLDLAPFQRDYCALVHEVWKTVPMVWRGGLPVRSPPPTPHRCHSSISRRKR